MQDKFETEFMVIRGETELTHEFKINQPIKKLVLQISGLTPNSDMSLESNGIDQDGCLLIQIRNNKK